MKNSIRKLKGKLKLRRTRSKPYKQKSYSTTNIIIIIGIVAIVGFIILAVILECRTDF